MLRGRGVHAPEESEQAGPADWMLAGWKRLAFGQCSSPVQDLARRACRCSAQLTWSVTGVSSAWDAGYDFRSACAAQLAGAGCRQTLLACNPFGSHAIKLEAGPRALREGAQNTVAGMKRAGPSTAFGASLELHHNLEARATRSDEPPTAPHVYPLQAPLSPEAAFRNSQVNDKANLAVVGETMAFSAVILRCATEGLQLRLAAATHCTTALPPRRQRRSVDEALPT